jgi:MoaA/NifB/PqqE/SkfB family radical SAM enzyme
MLHPISPWKIIAHSKKIKDILAGKDVSPITLGLDISNKCNHQCIWCLYDKYKKEKPYNMPKDLIKKAIVGFRDAGGVSCCLSGGGSPLMNEHINYAISECSKVGLESSLNTNGSRLNLLSNESLQSLSYIRISLDAGNRKSHYKLHKPMAGNFDEIIENIKNIRLKTSIPIGIGYLVHPLNYKDIGSLALDLNNIGVDYIQVRPIKGIGLSNEQMEAVLGQIDYIKNHIKTLKVYESFSKMKDSMQGKDQFNKCYINRLVPNIGPDGEVYSCCEWRGINSLGNIKDKSFGDIWFSDKHKDMLSNLDIKICPTCKYSKMNEIIERVFINDELNMNFI